MLEAAAPLARSQIKLDDDVARHLVAMERRGSLVHRVSTRSLARSLADQRARTPERGVVFGRRNGLIWKRAALIPIAVLAY